MDPSTVVVDIGSQSVTLPLVPLGDDLVIALLAVIDHGVGFVTKAGTELAALLAPAQPEIVVTMATLGIPVGIEVTRALGLDEYVVLQKTPKRYLADAVVEPVRSITTGAPQQLLLDRRRVPSVAGRRVAVVDDVISTGASTAAALRLVRAAGGVPVTVGAFLTEASGWRAVLGEDAERVSALGRIPVYRRDVAGALQADWGD